jgi:hypothetical protein
VKPPPNFTFWLRQAQPPYLVAGGENVARRRRATQNNNFGLIFSASMDSPITKANQNRFWFPRLRRGNFPPAVLNFAFGEIQNGKS